MLPSRRRASTESRGARRLPLGRELGGHTHRGDRHRRGDPGVVSGGDPPGLGLAGLRRRFPHRFGVRSFALNSHHARAVAPAARDWHRHRRRLHRPLPRTHRRLDHPQVDQDDQTGLRRFGTRCRGRRRRSLAHVLALGRTAGRDAVDHGRHRCPGFANRQGARRGATARALLRGEVTDAPAQRKLPERLRQHRRPERALVGNGSRNSRATRSRRVVPPTS